MVIDREINDVKLGFLIKIELFLLVKYLPSASPDFALFSLQLEELDPVALLRKG